MPKVRVLVQLKPDLLDTQGRAVADSLQRLGYDDVEARVGKMIMLEVDSVDKEQIDAMCQKLLANPVTEEWSWEVME